MTEADLQTRVEDVARTAGWLCYSVRRADLGRVTDRGFPDLVLVKPPRVAFIELKTDAGRIRPEQQTWLDELELCDTVTSAVVRPKHVDALLDYLMRP